MVVDVWNQSLYQRTQSFPSVSLACFVAGFTYFLRTIFGIIFKSNVVTLENLNAVNKTKRNTARNMAIPLKNGMGKSQNVQGTC